MKFCKWVDGPNINGWANERMKPSFSNILHYRPGQPIWEYTMWNFQDSSTAQILREINLDILKPQKLPFWTFDQLWILNFLETLDIFKCESPKIKIQSLENYQNRRFDLLKSTKIDFTVHQSGRKIA